MKATKKERQTFILNVIEQKVISTQQKLVDELEDAGFQVTQATISRDIRELKLTKMMTEEGVVCYHQPTKIMTFETRRLAKLLHQCYKYSEQQDKMMVIYTLAGSAPALSTLIMNVYRKDLFTVMSNDDHLLVIAKTEDKIKHIQSEIEELSLHHKEDMNVTRTFHP